MKRWLALPVVLAAGLVLAAASVADPGDGKKKHHKGTPASSTGTTTTTASGPKNAKLTFNVVTDDHGCEYRVWATDRIHRTYKVKRNENGSYTVRREDKGVFTTTGPKSPSADPCPGVVRRGKHGSTLLPGITGKMHGYIVGTVTGGTFIPNATCTAECTNSQFLAAFFTPGAQFTCVNGYAGCRFNFTYTAQEQKKQGLLYHHWVDRGLDGATEIFIGDIATS
jgi:hypothetical protein